MWWGLRRNDRKESDRAGWVLPPSPNRHAERPSASSARWETPTTSRITLVDVDRTTCPWDSAPVGRRPDVGATHRTTHFRQYTDRRAAHPRGQRRRCRRVGAEQ